MKVKAFYKCKYVSFFQVRKLTKDEVRVREFKTLVKLLKQRSKGTFPQFIFSSLRCELLLSEE